jgi:tRNA (guanine37-N1)-methyltransferase
MGKFWEALTDKLSREEMTILPKSFEIIGDIAIVKIPPELKTKEALIVDALVKMHRNIKTVLNQISPVEREFRVRKLEWVWGEKKVETIHTEYHCSYKVDISEVYFSPRLSYERMRIAQLVRRGENIVNMFAGVGCYSILIAKHSQANHIYSIDLNPKAVQLMRETITLNHVEGRVEAILGDAWKVIETRFQEKADRVLMPLPAKAFEYLDIALSALKSTGGMIHYYDFIHVAKGENPEKRMINKVTDKLIELHKHFEVVSSRVVRSVGPYWFQIVLDLKIDG